MFKLIQKYRTVADNERLFLQLTCASAYALFAMVMLSQLPARVPVWVYVPLATVWLGPVLFVVSALASMLLNRLSPLEATDDVHQA